MEAAQIMEYLGREYGIRSREELDEAASAMPGIDLGIFTVPYGAKARESKERAEVSALPLLEVPLQLR